MQHTREKDEPKEQEPQEHRTEEALNEDELDQIAGGGRPPINWDNQGGSY